MKQSIITKQLLNRITLNKYKSFKRSFITSLKQGMIAFLGLFLFLGLFEYAQSFIQGKPIVVLNKIDFAISVLGFLLMFAGKFLESFYGSNK